ncbi:hypothetical protein QC487_003178 [Listeria monocytogenes]|nr:hypothetical protein [Listeria monocytogenes]
MEIDNKKTTNNNYEQEIRAIQLSILRKADKKLNYAFNTNNSGMVTAIAELLKASF